MLQCLTVSALCVGMLHIGRQWRRDTDGILAVMLLLMVSSASIYTAKCGRGRF